MSTQSAAMYLDVVAAKAKQLADDARKGRLWPGDMAMGISECMKQLEAASREGDKQ
jgi:hypothetical protein